MNSSFINILKSIFNKGKQIIFKVDKFLFCYFLGFNYSEFNYYHFDKIRLKRLSFISYKECERIFPKYNKTILSKRDCYLKLKNEYNRDIILLDKTKDENIELLRLFINKHNCFVVKRFNGSSGLGVRKIQAKQDADWINGFLKEYNQGCLCESIIKQTPDIASINPYSINTLRITTVNYGKYIEAIYPVMRFGTGKKFVDNSGLNSLYCALDIDTGNIISAYNLTGKNFLVHPDTNQQIIGFKVPELEQAISFAKKLSLYFPNNTFTGFDFAHTNKGWVLVEANTETRFSIWQIPYQEGFRKGLLKINRLLKK